MVRLTYQQSEFAKITFPIKITKILKVSTRHVSNTHSNSIDMLIKASIRTSIKTIAFLTIVLCPVQGVSAQHEGDVRDVVTIDELDPSGPFNKI